MEIPLLINTVPGWHRKFICTEFTIPGWHRKFSFSGFTMSMSTSRFAVPVITCQGDRACMFSVPFTFYFMESAKKSVFTRNARELQRNKVCSSALKSLLSSSQTLEMFDLSWHGDSLSLQFPISLKSNWVAKLFFWFETPTNEWLWVTAPSQGLCKEWEKSMHNHIQVKSLGNLCCGITPWVNTHLWIHHTGRHCGPGWLLCCHKGNWNNLSHTNTHLLSQAEQTGMGVVEIKILPGWIHSTDSAAHTKYKLLDLFYRTRDTF